MAGQNSTAPSEPNGKEPVRVVISHSDTPQDRLLLQQFEVHLQPMQKRGMTRFWHRSMTSQGLMKDMEKVCRREHAEAQVIIALLSPDYFSGRYKEAELDPALKRDDLFVFPVLMRPVVPLYFGDLVCVPSVAITETKKNRDAAWVEVTNALLTMITDRLSSTSAGNRTRTPFPSPSRSRLIFCLAHDFKRFDEHLYKDVIRAGQECTRGEFERMQRVGLQPSLEYYFRVPDADSVDRVMLNFQAGNLSRLAGVEISDIVLSDQA